MQQFARLRTNLDNLRISQGICYVRMTDNKSDHIRHPEHEHYSYRSVLKMCVSQIRSVKFFFINLRRFTRERGVGGTRDFKGMIEGSKDFGALKFSIM